MCAFGVSSSGPSGRLATTVMNEILLETNMLWALGVCLEMLLAS